MKPPDDLVIHLCPPKGAAVCPCCGRTPFELPRDNRITVHVERVTCGPHPSASDEADQ